MDILGKLVDRVQDTVDSHPDEAGFPFGLQVNVACPLVKGIIQEVVDGVDNMMIVRGQFVGGPQLDILLEVAQIHGKIGELVFRRGNGALESEKFIDQLDDVCLGTDGHPYLHVTGPGDVLKDFLVERVGGGHGEAAVLNGCGEHQVFPGKGMGNGPRDQVEIKFKGVYFQVRQVPVFCEGLDDDLLVQCACRVIRSHEIQGGNDIHDGHRGAGEGCPLLRYRVFLINGFKSSFDTRLFPEYLLFLSFGNQPLVHEDLADLLIREEAVPIFTLFHVA